MLFIMHARTLTLTCTTAGAGPTKLTTFNARCNIYMGIPDISRVTWSPACSQHTNNLFFSSFCFLFLHFQRNFSSALDIRGLLCRLRVSVRVRVRAQVLPGASRLIQVRSGYSFVLLQCALLIRLQGWSNSKIWGLYNMQCNAKHAHIS